MKRDNTLSMIGRIRESAYRHIVLGLKEAGHEGIAPSHGDILVYLLRNGEAKLSVVADAIHRDRSTVTTLMKKLVKLGYVEMRKNPEDGRSYLVALTEKGRGIEPAMLQISEEIFAQLYAGISDEERQAFRETLSKIHDNLNL